MKLFISVIACLLLSVTVNAQSKTLGNEDFGVPEKKDGSSVTVTETYRNTGPTPKIEDSQKLAEQRESRLHIKTDDWKAAQLELLNKFFEIQSKGNSSDFCFCNDELASSLFSVKSWTVVDSKVSEDIGIFTVRVESSNKGGSPITLLWNVYIKKSKFKEYCVSVMSKAQN